MNLHNINVYNKQTGMITTIVTIQKIDKWGGKIIFKRNIIIYNIVTVLTIGALIGRTNNKKEKWVVQSLNRQENWNGPYASLKR